MGKRCLALFLSLILLFTPSIWSVYIEAASVQTEDQTKAGNFCKITFYDEKEEQIGTTHYVERGREISLKELSGCDLNGYNVVWKDLQTNEILPDSFLVQTDRQIQMWKNGKVCKINFHPNGTDVTGRMQQENITYGSKNHLARCTYKRVGYQFAGWAIEPTGSVIAEDTAEFDGVGYLNDQNTTLDLYAVWKLYKYEIIYHLNGGENAESNPKSYDYYSNIELKDPVRDGFAFLGWYRDKEYTERIGRIKKGESGDLELYARWKTKKYKIDYELKGGINHKKNPGEYDIKDTPIKLRLPKKAGYSFKGWYLDPKYKKKITKIKEGTYGNLKLYAKWGVSNYKITYHLRKGKNHRKNPVSYNYGDSYTLKNPTREGYHFSGWYLDRANTKRIQKITPQKHGDLELYAYWQKEQEPRVGLAAITSNRAAKKNYVYVHANIPKWVKSYDNKYYLITISPLNKKMEYVAASSARKRSLTFKLNVRKNRAYALSRYAVAVKTKRGYRRISEVSSYVKNPQKLATNRTRYKYGKTKKGIQSDRIDEAIKTGTKNIFLNLDMSVLLGNYATEPVNYIYNGKTYKFGNIGGYLAFVEKANKYGINVTLQLNLDQNTMLYQDQSLITVESRIPGHLYYAWNVREQWGREKMEAIFCYLAEKFGKNRCYVSNWILGNELNSCNVWYFRGALSDEQYIKDYAYAFRALYNAVKSVRASSKVYTCIDNIWNKEAPATGVSGRRFLHIFQAKLNHYQPGVNWDVSIHPYSVRMEYPEFWSGNSYYKDRSLVNGSSASPYITMKNLNAFTRYIKHIYGGGKSIILSEIGFDARRSKKRQAAALAYAYNIAACNPSVDAIMIRSFADEAGDNGLQFGIQGRRAYDVYRYMDTVYAENFTRQYLKTIKAKSWKRLIKGYNKRKLYKNYRN